MKVKICGITNINDALAACAAGADALGFIFAEEAKKRNRYVSIEAARAIVAELPPFVTTVAVTVNDRPELLRQYLDFVDIVQLHGEEPPGTIPDARAVKAFRAGPHFNLDALKAYTTRAWLLDACVPHEHGGTGHTCNWDIARAAVDLGRPVVLAGGLTPENVAEAIRTIQPFAVDTSSGVEEYPGKKDHDRVRRFIDNAKTSLA